MPTLERVHVCPLCEAGCGLSFQVRAGRAVAVEADARDVMSKGFVCPKGLAILVSLPHGYGHAGLGTWQKVAAAHAGMSANDWTDDGDVEAIVGQSILNGVPVTLCSLEASGPSCFDRAAPST